MNSSLGSVPKRSIEERIKSEETGGGGAGQRVAVEHVPSFVPFYIVT